MRQMRNLLVGTMLLAISPAWAETEPMPPQHEAMKVCEGTITDDCVVRQFKHTREAALIRGKVVYQTYCVLCHGATGKGDGRAAKIHNPRPANFTQSTLPLEYFRLIVPKGGEAMGRSKAMPPWGDQLTDEQIKDVTLYAYSLRENKD